MAELTYQTLQVENTGIPQGGPSTRGQAAESAVKLLHKLSIALNGWAVSHRVNQELEKLQPEIEKSMPQNGGVLVCVGIQEWAIPDPTGTRAQMFLSIHVAGSGHIPGDVLRRYLSQPRLETGAPPGWRRKDAYIWVTPK